MAKKINIDLDEMKALYDLGLSDNEIAKKLGCNRKSVSLRRNRLGLPVNTWWKIDE